MGLVRVVLLFILSILLETYALPACAHIIKQMDKTLIEETQKVEQIAKHMGRKPQVSQLLTVKQVQPRHLSFQARELYKKLNQLHLEITGHEEPAMYRDVHPAKITYENVQDELQQVNKVLDNIKEHLSIKKAIQKEDDTTQHPIPSTLFNRLTILNQMVNQLLEREAQPSEVYQNVTLAVFYAGELLKKMPGATKQFKEVPIVYDKYPKDVFLNLLHILSKVISIAHQLNIETLEILNTHHISTRTITPSDVKELSLIIVSELSFICFTQGVSTRQLHSYYPGKKYPSDVYYRSMKLETYVNEIFQYIKHHPQWINNQEDAEPYQA